MTILNHPADIMNEETRTIFSALALPSAICALGLALFWSLPAHAAPNNVSGNAQALDCAVANERTEFEICNNEVLLMKDEKLATIFQRQFINASTRPEQQAVSRDQQKWLDKRNACGSNAACIGLRYDERLRQLSNTSL